MSALTAYTSNVFLGPITNLNSFYVFNKYLLTKSMKFYVCSSVHNQLKEANYGRDQL